MQHVLVALQYEKSSSSEVENAVAHSRHVTKNLECAKFFLPFIFYAYECCMTKLVYVRY